MKNALTAGEQGSVGAIAALATLDVDMAQELDVGDLYRQHGEFIARVIERLTGDDAHVDDLLQECFVSLLSFWWVTGGVVRA